MRNVEAEETEEYQNFVDKFKHKLTTDDCYTLPEVYDAVAAYVANHYKLDRQSFVRPFGPGADYTDLSQYVPGCCVVDNPPFSICAKIIDFYDSNGIKFFLFANGRTVLNLLKGRKRCTAVMTGQSIPFENGASINTNFITNLTPGTLCETSPALYAEIEDAKRAISEKKRTLPNYQYPMAVMNFSDFSQLAKAGISFSVKRGEGVVISRLDAQKEHKKTIYGCGILCSREAEARRREENPDIVWHLSDREKTLQAEMDKK